MSNTVNIRYKGTNGSARKFAEEMVSSGTVTKIRNDYGASRKIRSSYECRKIFVR